MYCYLRTYYMAHIELGRHWWIRHVLECSEKVSVILQAVMRVVWAYVCLSSLISCHSPTCNLNCNHAELLVVTLNILFCLPGIFFVSLSAWWTATYTLSPNILTFPDRKKYVLSPLDSFRVKFSPITVDYLCLIPPGNWTTGGQGIYHSFFFFFSVAGV